MPELVVLDASAVLAIVNNEPGADEVAATSGDAIISAVNWSEVVAKSFDQGLRERDLDDALGRFDFGVLSFDRAQADAAGLLRPVTRAAGLSLGDRACLALASSRSLPVLTGDRKWVGLPVHVDIRLIR